MWPFKKKKNEVKKEVRPMSDAIPQDCYSPYSGADGILLATMLADNSSIESPTRFGGGSFGGAGAGSYFDSDYSSSSSDCGSSDSGSCDSGDCGGCD